MNKILSKEMAMINYANLAFGAPAAERDIAQGLKEYFVESESYRNLRDGKKTICIGNRGSGKSALFKMLAEHARSKGFVVIELSPEDYSYEMLSNTMVRESEGSWVKHGAYAAAWKYLIYVLVMKRLTEDSPRLKSKEVDKIYRYLRDNHKGFQENPIALLISYLKRIENIKIGPFQASIKTRELDSLYKLEEINELLPSVKKVCERKKVLVLIDELDKGWDASEDAKAFVAGLFQASISINSLTPNLRVIISLRRELYDNIPALYEDSQKVRDIMETIEWNEEMLLQLIGKRIAYSFPEIKDKEYRNLWNLIFSETLDYRQTKSFNYMIDRTLYRPREIIQFCTIARDEAIKRKLFPIDYSVISRAELFYSEERTKDIAAEYRFQYPGLLSIFEAFRGRSYNFDRGALEELLLGVSTGEFRIDETADWAKNMEPRDLINILWKIGFIRAQAVGGLKAHRRSGSEYLGSHQISVLNLNNIQRFHVHPMFRTFLGMKESRDRTN